MRLLFLPLLFGLATHSAVAASQGPTIACTVERITDGDTIRCDGESVRLLMIDAPEAGQGPFGGAAREFLAAILPLGSEARLVLDLEQRDQYDRLLAYVYRTDGRMVNAMMVRQGFAVPLVVPPNVRYVEAIRAAADSARAAGIGLWAVEAFECSPADYRDGRCGQLAAEGPLASEQHAASISASGEDCDPVLSRRVYPTTAARSRLRRHPHRRFRVVGGDPHRFDGHRDGVGCEGR